MCDLIGLLFGNAVLFLGHFLPAGETPLQRLSLITTSMDNCQLGYLESACALDRSHTLLQCHLHDVRQFLFPCIVVELFLGANKSIDFSLLLTRLQFRGHAIGFCPGK